MRSWRELLPANARRRILRGPPAAPLFHALNQRVDYRARRTVATFHDLFVMTGEYSTPEFRARFTAQAREAAARSDLIIAVSKFTAGQVEQLLGVEPARIRVIPHGVHMPAARPVGPVRENLVLTVGAIQKRKNVARLVRAFERMPEGWRLAIAGSAEGFAAAEELRAVEESPRRPDIDVLGYVTPGALEELYRRARIFAFPSLDEGFGMPVLEAMAHGLPVVTSMRSGVAETAGGAAVLVDPEGIEELAEALKRLAEDEQLAHDLTLQGRDRALQFPWKAAVERTWALYEELGLGV
jgi:glycosyltransferase involved in cell wall biosynthesis